MSTPAAIESAGPPAKSRRQTASADPPRPDAARRTARRRPALPAGIQAWIDEDERDMHPFRGQGVTKEWDASRLLDPQAAAITMKDNDVNDRVRRRFYVIIVAVLAMSLSPNIGRIGRGLLLLFAGYVGTVTVMAAWRLMKRK